MQTSQRISPDVFFIDRTSKRTLQDQLRIAVVDGVVSGHMKAGTRLPSTRRLAAHLNLSRITITLAFQELVAQGYLRAIEKSGYIIAKDTPVPHLKTGKQQTVQQTVNWSKRLRTRAQVPAGLARPTDWQDYPYPFIYGHADMSVFDQDAWRDCIRRASGARLFDEVASDYQDADDELLLDVIRRSILPRRGIEAQPANILVTNGSQHALWLTTALLARFAGRVACEDPRHPDLASTLSWHDMAVFPVPVDGDGLMVESIPAHVQAVFVTPNGHAPGAVTMPMARRTALLERAWRDDFLVVEDDYDSELTTGRPTCPAIRALDGQERVIYTGSFTKVLFPGLRLGYLVGPAPFIAEARRLRSLMVRHPAGLLQRAVAHFVELGHYDGLVQKTRTVLARRRAIAVEAVGQTRMELACEPRAGGTSLWLKTPDGVAACDLALAARQKGVLVDSGTPFMHQQDHRNPYFRLVYTSIREDRIAEGIRMLDAIVPLRPTG